MPKKLDFDWDKLNAILQFKPSLTVCSDYLGVSGDTIERHIKKKHSQTFSEYRDKVMAPLKIKLQQKAIAMALSGNSALMIFCLKNLCQWEDNKEVVVNNTQVTVSKDDLEERIKLIKGEK